MSENPDYPIDVERDAERRAQAFTDTARIAGLAEELCRYDDSLHHMEGTDDFPCWHCKAKAAVVLDTDWLADVVAQAKAEALRGAAACAELPSTAQWLGGLGARWETEAARIAGRAGTTWPDLDQDALWRLYCSYHDT